MALSDSPPMEDAIREAWARLAPPAAWRGFGTGWHALDCWTLASVVHQLKPQVALVAGRLAGGGVPLLVADCMDDNHRGKVVAGEAMGTERRRALPDHRRIQWVPKDLVVADFRTAERLTERANPVLVVTDPAALLALREVAGLVTPGSYLVVHGGAAVEARHYPEQAFIVDPGRDPAGLSACAWLLRVPA